MVHLARRRWGCLMYHNRRTALNLKPRMTYGRGRIIVQIKRRAITFRAGIDLCVLMATFFIKNFRNIFALKVATYTCLLSKREKQQERKYMKKLVKLIYMYVYQSLCWGLSNMHEWCEESPLFIDWRKGSRGLPPRMMLEIM